MALRILSVQDALHPPSSRQEWALVSIAHPGDLTEAEQQVALRRVFGDILAIAFDDVVPYLPMFGIPPTRQQIRDVIRWCDGRDLDRLAVCCRKGVSRSAAIALVVACSHGYVAGDAFDRLIDTSRQHPNRMVLELGAAILERPDLLEEYRRRYHNDWAEELVTRAPDARTGRHGLLEEHQ